MSQAEESRVRQRKVYFVLWLILQIPFKDMNEEEGGEECVLLRYIDILHQVNKASHTTVTQGSASCPPPLV